MAEKNVILIVDDTPENLRLLGDMLEACGYEVLVATSGQQALATAQASPPDIILLDILMPDLDGYQVCRLLKDDPQLKRIPVIFLSVLDMPEQKIRAFHEGAVDYITKPFQSEEVVARVATHLRLTQIEVLQQEIVERRLAEQALRQQTEELGAIYQNAPLVMMIVDEGHLVRKINRPVSDLNLPPLAKLVGRPIGEVVHCLYAGDGCGQGLACRQCAIGQTVIDTFASGARHQQVQGQVRSLVNGQRQEGWYLLSTERLNLWGAPAVLLCLLDISEQHRLQEQVIRQQKFESLGTLAGGIAHDFNNILSAIMGFTDLALLRGAEETSGVRDDLAQIRKASTRATELVRQILTFSRKQHQETQPLQVSLIVKEALKLMRASIPATIEIRQEIVSQAVVLADPTHIHQVVMNLCTNAYQAMMEEGGVLTVSLRERVVEAPLFEGGAEIPPGGYVVLAVSDSGCGMSREVLSQIFEPYFTTKGKGKGTGLGLAVVHGIIQNHQGRITVVSEPGPGTTFAVYLPLVQQVEMAAVEELPPPPVARAGERVMVVDDESSIRELACQFLRKAGYHAEAFASGLEAWQALAQRPNDWDLLLTDQTMPGMTGEQLADKALSLHPGLPIILCSGYMTAGDGSGSGRGTIFLQKPIDRHVLLTAIAKALHG